MNPMRWTAVSSVALIALVLTAAPRVEPTLAATGTAAAPTTPAAKAKPASVKGKSTRSAKSATSKPPTGGLSLTDSLRLDPAVRTGVLPNGIRYYVKRNAKPEQRVSLRLVIAAGSTAEEEDQRGLAHFAEHMNFNGTKHFAPDEMVSYLRSIGLRFGADANAYTSFDETVYMLEVPTDRDTLLDKGFVALSDFAGGATLLDTEIEKERGVVLEEWRLGQGASERMRRKQFPVLFHGSLYAERIPIGKPEVIEKAPTARLKDFYRDWYTADRMAVVAVGDLAPARLDSLVRAHFSNVPRAAQPRPTPSPEIPPHKETLYSVATDKEATFSSVQVLYKHPRVPERTVGDYRRGLVEGLFQTMMNSRLSEIAHRADAPFLYAGSFAGELGRKSRYSGFAAGVTDGGIDKGLEALLVEAERVRRHGFLANELDRAKRELMAASERAYAEREKSESRAFAGQYVAVALSGDPEPGIEASHRMTQALLPGITLAEVTELALRQIHDESRVILATAPDKAGLLPPTEAGLKAVVARASGATIAEWKDETAGRALMTAPTPPGTVRERRQIPEIGVTVLTLSNGVEAWLKPTEFKADEIVFTAYGVGGASNADSVSFTTAALSASVVGEAGVGGFTSVELEKLLAGKVVNVRSYVEDYTQGVAGSCRPQDLETALQLVYLHVTRPTENPDAVPTLKKQLQAYLADRANSPEAVFQDTVVAVNTGNFYMDRTLTKDAVDRLALEPALDFYRRRFANAADLTFFIVGTFQVDSIAPLVARYLGALPSEGRRTSNFAPIGPRFPTSVRRATARKGVEPKSSTRVTFFGDAGGDELTMHRARAAGSILSDRLRQKLREELGGTYGVGANYSGREPLKGYGTTTVSFGSAPQNVEKMVAATLEEIEKLRAEGPTAADVQKEQEVERRELEVAMQRNPYWMGSLQTVHLFGWDARRIAKRRERIDLLTPDLLKQTFQQLFPRDRYTIVTLMPETEVKAE